MALTWLQLARDGAPPASDRTIEMINENKRKIFAKPPTVGPNGELDVTPAVFKPRPRNKPTTDADGDTPVAASSSAPASRAAAPTRAPAVNRPAPAASRPAPFSASRPAPFSASRAAPSARRGTVPVAVTQAAASPVTFPNAVSILNSAQQGRSSSSTNVDDESDDSDDDAAAGVASYYELMDELTTRHNCDAVRRMIQRFLARKSMTQTAFLRTIEVNHNSFTKFMSYSGRDKGHGNKTYQAALLFFHGLEQEEGAAVGSGRARAAATTTTTSASTNKVSRKEQAMMAEAFFNKINNIVLHEPVYVFDDCDDVRQKLHALIESKAVTQTALLKHMGVTTTSLRRFLTTKGKREGCTINVYKFAYVMFEKLRIAHGHPKTKKRLKHESELPEGFSLKRDPTHYYLLEGETVPGQS